MHVRECQWCHREFQSVRRDARFCSQRCRTANSRWVAELSGRGALPVVLMRDGSSAPVDHPITESEIAEQVIYVRAAASALSAAALTADARYAPLCRRLADGLLAVLGEVGL